MTVEKVYKTDSQVIEYTNEWYDQLIEFFKKAKELKLENNISFDAMKWDIAKWWISVDDNKIVGISGCHPLPEGQTEEWRVMFRAAILPEYRNRFKNLTRSNINSETTHYHMPLQINWIKKNYLNAKRFVITTNVENENPVYMKSNRVFYIMEGTGIVKKLRTDTIYYTEQTVWEVSEERLLSIRREFRERLGYNPNDLDDLE